MSFKEGDDTVFFCVETNISIEDTLFLKEFEVNKWKFPIGYATVLFKDKLKCYFAIKVMKDLLDSVDENILQELMGDNFIILDNNDSLLYLRDSLEEKYLNYFTDKTKFQEKLFNLLETT